ncbi:serine hydrolase [Pleurocapsa sp. PCC 7319]|uniref:serine hydrolase domain-containing protein n=1 Tax=Pleurocapsa sp. PCC 7319 TaxID=118161 RepID=UPI000349F0CD|nr:serine hydrolase domain-containing protein [Pleurocapsa sp. PCC 7319]
MNSDLKAKIERVENGLLLQSENESSDAKYKLRDRMEFYQVPGVSIAVIDRGKIDWAKGYGVKEAGSNDPIDSQSLFQAASISKPVTATAIMQLVQLGKLNLDSDVNEKLVSWQISQNLFTQERKVTLRNLLSHTAGMTVHGFVGYSSDESVPTLLQIINGEKPANSDEIKVNSELNQEFRYSGGGYVIIQQLLEDFTGQPFDEFIQETVLDKLEMTNSTFKQPLPEAKVNSAAVGHNDKGKPIDGSWHTYPEMAAAGLWTTPTDLAKLAIAIQKSIEGKQDSILNRQTVHEMLSPQIGGWGLGFKIPEENLERFAHAGANEGYQCLMLAEKNTGRGAVIMTNSDCGIELGLEIIASIKQEYDWE